MRDKNEKKIYELANDAIEATAQHLEGPLAEQLAAVRDVAGVASAKRLDRQLRAAWVDPKTGIDDHGRDPNKVKLAKASHKPVTKEKIRNASKSEQQVAKMIGHGAKVNEREEHNHPADISVKVGSKLHGIEVKRIEPGAKNDKVTVHPSSRQRKEDWAKTNKAALHLVAHDTRKGSQFYYRFHVGAYRLKGMIPVKSGAHLHQLVSTIRSHEDYKRAYEAHRG